jgi:hypothetical protein
MPLATLDIDIMIDASELDRTRRAVHRLGFTERCRCSSMKARYIRRVSKIEHDTGET